MSLFSACAASQPGPGDSWTSTDTLRAAARLPAMDGSRHSFYKAAPPAPPSPGGSLTKRPAVLAGAAEDGKEPPRSASEAPMLQSGELRDIFFGGSESSNPEENTGDDVGGLDGGHRASTDTGSTSATQDGSQYAGSTAGVSRAFVKDASGYGVGWMFDDESTSCVRCDGEFTAVKRRHHCRMCGVLVCGACSDFNLPVKGLRPGNHRVCADCFGSANSAPTLSGDTFLSSLRARGWSGGARGAATSPDKAARPQSDPRASLPSKGQTSQLSSSALKAILEPAAEPSDFN